MRVQHSEGQASFRVGFCEPCCGFGGSKPTAVSGGCIEYHGDWQQKVWEECCGTLSAVMACCQRSCVSGMGMPAFCMAAFSCSSSFCGMFTCRLLQCSDAVLLGGTASVPHQLHVAFITPRVEGTWFGHASFALYPT